LPLSRTPNAPCRFSETFGYGYTTECQQRYIYRQLLSLNDQNQLTKEVFKLPSCCKCIIKQVNARNNFGGDQSAASRRKRNAKT
jgi:Spaetzle